MNRRNSILLSVLVFSLVCSFAATVYAATPSLASGYAVTSNYQGQDVPPGASVIVTAMTTDHRVDKVIFIWKDPSGHTAWTDTVSVFHNGTTYNGIEIYYAISTHTPSVLGDWGVQAKFINVVGFCWWTFDCKVACRATSFNVIPEVPIIGTAGASIAMVLGLAYKMKRKPLK
jgi:hypothetical protein